MKFLPTCLTGLLLLFGCQIQAQSDEPKKLEVDGYVKSLQSTTLAGVPGFPLTNNFLHNRFNLHYYPNEHWTLVVEARNRLFYGEQVKLDSTYGKQIDQYDGLVDLSVRWVDNETLVLHSILDRVYVNYASEKWDLRLGRQRINWGVNLAWNPNDLFNALNFLDFDYEERPGRDAMRVQYYPGMLSRLEIAVAPGKTDSTTVAAMLYRFNLKGYDVQTIAGYYQGQLALGGGWEGSVKGAGFKGEGTWFYPIADYAADTTQGLGMAITLDYLLPNNLYLSGAGLYNSDGKRATLASGANLFSQGATGLQPSARNLFPAGWTYLIQVSGKVTPLLSTSGGLMYAPRSAFGQHMSIFIPSVTYSIKENWDIDLIGQLFFSKLDPQAYQHLVSSLFFRLKWSY